MKLRFTTNANRRLIQIQDYHNDLGNPKKDRRIANEILDRAKELETYPGVGDFIVVVINPYDLGRVRVHKETWKNLPPLGLT